jgi:hypothetical protein
MKEELMLKEITILKREICFREKKKFYVEVEKLKARLSCQESELSSIIESKKKETILNHISALSDDTGNMNNLKMWKLKRKVCPKNTDKPSAKINKKGEFVTNKVKLKELYVETYKERLSHRDVHPGYEVMSDIKMYLFRLRYEVTRRIKSPDWTKEEMLKVLKSLKSDKSTDHFGLIYEIFKPDVINDDMFNSLLTLCNKVKSQLLIPKFLEYTDITSIYKNKGDRYDLENDRGIFGVGKIRSIIEKLAYNDSYEKVDSKISARADGGPRSPSAHA